MRGHPQFTSHHFWWFWIFVILFNIVTHFLQDSHPCHTVSETAPFLWRHLKIAFNSILLVFLAIFMDDIHYNFYMKIYWTFRIFLEYLKLRYMYDFISFCASFLEAGHFTPFFLFSSCLNNFIIEDYLFQTNLCSLHSNILFSIYKIYVLRELSES